MLKIKILKSGKFGLHSAWGGTVMFTKGDEFDEGAKLKDIYGKETNANNELNIMSREVARRMEDAKWAKLTEEEPEEEEQELEKGPVSDLIKLLEGVETDKEKKSKIQDWSVVNYGINPSSSKKVENMILEIEDYIANNQGEDSGTE